MLSTMLTKKKKKMKKKMKKKKKKKKKRKKKKMKNDRTHEVLAKIIKYRNHKYYLFIVSHSSLF
jgi:isopropylmalate/homocitrate/citramalate synthase